MDTFRFRLNCLDHYQATPTELDPQLSSGGGLSQRHNAPPIVVIRAFGATETGQKVCAHIHGALPYVYLKYEGSLDDDAVDSYMHDLRISIDHALATSYRRNAYDGKAKFVGHITLVKGVPFYGYTVGYEYFLKVYMLNPTNMTRLADLLSQGAVMNKVIQPFEMHLQFLLQWMCDFNLYGCAYIDSAKVMFRSPVPAYMDMNSLSHKWHDESIRPDWISNTESFPRQSHCSLEVDICVEDILNRKEIRPRPLHQDFIERFHQIGPDEKFVNSMASLWRDETLRRKRRMGLKDPGSSPFPPEVFVSMSAGPRNTDSGGWIHEDEFRQVIEDLIREEEQKGSDPGRNFENFLERNTLEKGVQTALESVADLFSHNVRRARLEPLENFTVSEASSDRTPEHVSDDMTINLDREPDVYRSELETIGEEPGKGIDSMLDDKVMQNGKRVQTSPARNRAKRSRISTSEPLSPSHADINARANNDIMAAISSQSSIKSTKGPTTFSFPVVKDPNDPETRLRLSQREFSNSQKAPQTPASKIIQQFSTPAATRTPWGLSMELTPQSNRSHTKLSSEAAQLVKHLQTGLIGTSRSYSLFYGFLPPSSSLVESSMIDYGVPPTIYQDAYYGDEKDVPDRAREYAGREFRLQSTTIPFLPAFDASGTSSACRGENSPVLVDKITEELRHSRRRHGCSYRCWEYAESPPACKEVEKWTREQLYARKSDLSPMGSGSTSSTLGQANVTVRSDPSQIEGPTQRNKHGFKFSQNKASTSVLHETQYMSIMSLEVHVNNRGSLVPDPAEDEVACIFWCLQSDDDGVASSNGLRTGVLALSNNVQISEQIRGFLSPDIELETENDELDLINRMVDIVRECDPDILTGYEVHNGSWGFLIERARLKYEFDICDEFSRMKAQSHGRFGKEADRWGFTHTSTIRITGRHMINVWRAMRSELNLLQYTLENVAFHLLHKRIPHYHYSDLTKWYKSGLPSDVAKTTTYFLDRIRLNIDILEANELVARTSEQARLLGVDFFSVFSRGSQYKVESLMFRIAKPENFILPSPTRKQVGQQNALECLPLVMEPQSNFYSSPLLVLDFQSLYPSVMIAYNYCYSTCLGRIVSWRGQNKMGYTDFKRAPGLLPLVKDYINVAPNGMMYVKPEMRKSLLAKMLGEILETRVMVKSGMKVDKDDKTLQQLLNNRQLALKLIANVTYGYASASFSGRMPCSEIADSIVQTGRETLEKAIALIHSVDRWGAEVVYGDTDSLFVYLKGRTRDQAFKIGHEIAAAVTKANPRPVKLKFEKVYHPCVLIAKKRYVGFKYESPSQTEPDFDAKGIETVRRDGTPAEQKIEEKALKMLFRTADLSAIKGYFQSQCTKIMSGRISIQDFLFAKEVKLGSYSDKGPPPPGALLATRRMLNDARTEPQYGERIPYVVVSGAPGARLIDRCVDPEVLLRDDHLELDAEYYISKNLIPPLERIFNLVGANVRQWFDEMPKVQRIRNVQQHQADEMEQPILKKTMESYMKSSLCIVCRAKLPPPTNEQENNANSRIPLCDACSRFPSRSLLTLRRRMQKAQTRAQDVERVCRSCAGLTFGEEVRCDSRDCPVYYTRVRERSGLAMIQDTVGVVVSALETSEMEKEKDLEW
ncbi:DNA polymeras-like protein zeta catalytic subunit [Pseudovirgaria hyperparasitica]|uniref:DNA polymerase n=1 Tax=Pseudovirgaria hyperparasitica TaxID=470096 RepID=A0A6A6W8D7_9PEZI|nr:DNA polymeras-like protein zeta catalytic subunit [Pseudovirgaria hyperparasitica]KAF2757341.1 DNA polymeras-like protein zeta catalytic subunit [Pseudovirgaria hyperparasitica]